MNTSILAPVTQVTFLQTIQNLADIAQDSNRSETVREIALARIFGKCEARQTGIESKLPDSTVLDLPSIENTMVEIDALAIEVDGEPS